MLTPDMVGHTGMLDATIKAWNSRLLFRQNCGRDFKDEGGSVVFAIMVTPVMLDRKQVYLKLLILLISSLYFNWSRLRRKKLWTGSLQDIA